MDFLRVRSNCMASRLMDWMSSTAVDAAHAIHNSAP